MRHGWFALLVAGCAANPAAELAPPSPPSAVLHAPEIATAAPTAKPPEPEPPSCPPVPEPDYKHALHHYRQQLSEWLKADAALLAKLNSVEVSSTEKVTGEPARNASLADALWLREELRTRLQVPTAAKVYHKQIQELVRTLKAHPFRRAYSPIVGMGGMGGYMTFEECDGYPRRETPRCERYRSAYWLLDRLADDLSPTLHWQSYRPPDFEAQQREAEREAEWAEAEDPATQDSKARAAKQKAPECPKPVVFDDGGAPFTSVFERAIAAGANARRTRQLALELFRELHQRSLRAARADGVSGLEGAFLTAAHRALPEAQSLELLELQTRARAHRAATQQTPERAEELESQAQTRLVDEVLQRYGAGLQREELSRFHSDCPAKQGWSDVSLCMAPFSFHLECYQHAGKKYARCLSEEYEPARLAALLYVLAGKFEQHVLAAALEEVLLAHGAGDGRTGSKRVLEIYSAVFSSDSSGAAAPASP